MSAVKSLLNQDSQSASEAAFQEHRAMMYRELFHKTQDAVYRIADKLKHEDPIKKELEDTMWDLLVELNMMENPGTSSDNNGAKNEP